jgi:hypothetical protein
MGALVMVLSVGLALFGLLGYTRKVPLVGLAGARRRVAHRHDPILAGSVLLPVGTPLREGDFFGQ